MVEAERADEEQDEEEDEEEDKGGDKGEDNEKEAATIHLALRVPGGPAAFFAAVPQVGGRYSTARPRTKAPRQRQPKPEQALKRRGTGSQGE